MIISWLSGGLGNQMFQYALGRVLAEKNGDTLKLDITAFDVFQAIDTPRSYELDIFSFQVDFASRSEIMRLSDPNPLVLIVNKYLGTSFPPFPKTCIREKSNNYQSNISSVSGDIYLYGFWQTEKYFKDYRNMIVKEFNFNIEPEGKNIKLLKEIMGSSSVSIHVRRGDYVTNVKTKAFHGQCGVDYYQRSIQFIKRKVKDPIFYVFSDDSDWCKNNLKFDDKAVFVSNNYGDKSWEDMRLMSLCKHNIIANSSFSWWGAWLNINPEKIVIAPKRWFLNKNANSADIAPDSWVKL